MSAVSQPRIVSRERVAISQPQRDLVRRLRCDGDKSAGSVAPSRMISRVGRLPGQVSGHFAGPESAERLRRREQVRQSVSQGPQPVSPNSRTNAPMPFPAIAATAASKPLHAPGTRSPGRDATRGPITRRC